MTKLDDIMRGEDAVARNTVMVLDAFYDWMDTPPKRETTMPKLTIANITDDKTERLIVLARAIVSNWTHTGPFDKLAAAVRDMGALLTTDSVPATTRSYSTTNERIDEALVIVDELIEWADADAQHASENDARDTARDDMRRGTQLRTARKLIEDSRR